MADKNKSQVEQNALRVAQWLAGNSEFEQQGINEDQVVAAVGLPEKDATAAIDYLENREEVVRMPKALTPPQFLLKPGRAWSEVRDKVLGKTAGR